MPDQCALEVDRRVLINESIDDVLAEYCERLDKIKSQRDDFRYVISEPTLNASALDTSLDSPVVTAVSRAYEETFNVTPAPRAFAGSTDAPNIGAPAVICGPGSIAQAHSLNEFVELEQVTAAARIYLRSALTLLTS